MSLRSFARALDTAWRLPSAPAFVPDVERDLGVHYVETKAGVVRVVDVGDASSTPIVMTPDAPNVIEHHVALHARARERGRRVVCVELPGFGKSVARRGFGFTLADNAACVVDVLDARDVTSCVLALSCVAGLLGPAIAALRPGLVRAVVAVQTPSLVEEKRWARRVDPGGLVATPFAGQALLRAFPARVATGWYRAAFPRNVDDATLAAHTRTAVDALSRGARFPLASALQALHDANDVGIVDAPAIALWGTADRTHRKTDRASTSTWLPRARVVEVDAGHFPELERPDAFLDAVDAVLEER